MTFLLLEKIQKQAKEKQVPWKVEETLVIRMMTM